MLFKPRFFLVGLILALPSATTSAATKSIQIDLDAEPELIGDIKPAFLNFDQEPLPAVPIKEIIRRYRQLFNDTSVPSVRIDVLHRLTNLEAIYGDPTERSLEEERALYKKALDSYEMIVGTGVYYNRIDELLYQTAKAYDFTGQYERSLKSLEQLVALYPNSNLAIEARFRVSEAHFSLGHYDKAEKSYKKSLVNSEDSKFYDNAMFMMGWSQFKQNKYDQSGKTFIKVLDRLYQHAQDNNTDLLGLGGIQGETARDTLRVMSITFSYDKGAQAIDSLLNEEGNKPYSHLLYLQLADLYLSQQRYEDSASAARAYINRFGGDSQAPMMHHSIINAYVEGGFPLKVWEEKEAFVADYSPAFTKTRARSLSTSAIPLSVRAISEKNRAEVAQWLREYLQELSHYYYVSAQKQAGASNKAKQHSKVSRSSASDALYRKAGGYYRLLVAAFPADEQVGEHSFLAAESFYKANDLDKAIADYEYSAYQSGVHSFALEAGYAAVLTHNELKALNLKQTDEQKQQRLESIQLFTTRFSDDKRVPAVLNDLANEHLKAHQYENARKTSRGVLDHPLATKELKRSSWLVNGHSNFELQDYASAEHAYGMATELMGSKSSSLSAINERMAASIYRQGEQAISVGDRQAGIDQFMRLSRVVPASPLVVNAQYDAAVQMLALGQWRKAIVVLNRFMKQYPTHALAEDIPEKLIFAHLESGNKLEAANQLVALSKRHPNTEKSREALYQAADLYASAGVKDKSVALLSQYVKKYPKPFDLYIEGHQTIADYYGEIGDVKKRDLWLSKLVKADASAGTDRNTRSKFLAASASMILAQKSLDEFASAKLNLPLKKSLKKKSVLLKKAVGVLQAIPKYGVAQLTTEATFKLAELYRQLGSDILVSERPSSLNELQLEQYEILLEEQAYPFEEKSIEVHEINISRTKDGIYDDWVKESYQILSTIVPARYLRGEKSVGLDSNIQ